jgi:hypothetical protein
MTSCLSPNYIQPGIKDRLAELPASVRGPIEQEIAACIAQRTAGEQAVAEAGDPTVSDIISGIYSCYSTPESLCYGIAQGRINAAHREARPELYVSPQSRGPHPLHRAMQERQAAQKRLFTSMGIAALLGFFLARR